MRLLSAQGETIVTNITTAHYEIPGYDPEDFFIREICKVQDPRQIPGHNQGDFLLGEICKVKEGAGAQYDVELVGGELYIPGATHPGASNPCISPSFVEPGFFDNLRTMNPWGDGFEQTGVIKTSTYAKVPVSQWKKEWENWKIVFLNGWDSMIYDSEGVPLPCAEWVNGTFFEHRMFNLTEDFLSHLRNHPWVVNKDDIRVEFSCGYECVHVRICPDRDSYLKALEIRETMEHWSVTEILSGEPFAFGGDTPDFLGIGPFMKSPR